MSNDFVTYSFQSEIYNPKLNVKNTQFSSTFYYPCSNTYQCQPYYIQLRKGVYKFEAWAPFTGHEIGSYTSGVIKLIKTSPFFVYIGGMPSGNHGGYNGGGDAYSTKAEPGAGATDIRLDESLHSRIMVAAGSGGFDISGTGKAGTDVGLSCSDKDSDCGGGATQTAPGSGSPPGSFGKGGSDSVNDGGGGGGGYWGGGHGGGVFGGGGGGSSFVSGHPYCNAVKSATSTDPAGTPIHYSGLAFESPVMIGASDRIPDPEDPSKFLSLDQKLNGVFRITLIESHTGCRTKKIPMVAVAAFAAIALSE